MNIPNTQLRPERVEFNGCKYKLSGNYYRRNVWGSSGPSNLHRAIWAFCNGPIPEGFEVHHKDEDPFNNLPDNLECVPMHEHQRAHMLERIARGVVPPISDLARQRAAEWHRSDDGREWASKNSIAIWEKREWTTVSCQVCAKEFETPYPTRAKFCHQNCKAKALRKRRAEVK